MKVGDRVRSHATLNDDDDLYPWQTETAADLYPLDQEQAGLVLDLIQKEGVVVEVYQPGGKHSSLRVMWQDGSLQWTSSHLVHII